MPIQPFNRPQESPFSRLIGMVSGGLGLYNQVQNVKKTGMENDVLEAQRNEATAARDPSSAQSQQARADYTKLTGSPIADSVSKYQLEAKYGPLAKYVQSDLEGKRELERDKHRIALKGDEDRKTDLAKAGLDQKRNPEKYAFERLPIENQEQVKNLAGKTAERKAIKNSIDSALETLQSPQVSEDQKIAAGQQLLKTLNSDQGRDAVGAEEAKRLSSFLNFKMGNMTQPGSFWGRDMEEFTEQVSLKSQELGGSIERNDSEIARLKGSGSDVASAPRGVGGKQRKGGMIPEAWAGKNKPNFTPEDLQALQWAQSNPTDRRAGEIMRNLKGKGL